MKRATESLEQAEGVRNVTSLANAAIASIAVRINVFDSGELVDFADRVEARIGELPEHLSGRVTGNSVLMARTSDDIAFGQAISLSSAFVIIFAILALLFTSLRVGFLAMLPNVLPVIIYFGALGWTGISLNVTTGLVACLVLGIAVDGTIHYLARFSANAKELADERKGVERALVDITFTPALAAGMRIVTLWDVLSLDLGERPQEAIPLLHGLTSAQARITALMTELHTYPAGHRLIRRGDSGEDGIYVLIEGQLRSSVDRAGQPVTLNTHERGDVVGEVGFFKGKRSAHVDCVTDVRLIRLDEENLSRLRRRYPRIGAQVFRNLSEILASRLVKATERLA